MIYILQHLCPSRHCIMAVAFDAITQTQEEAEKMLADNEKAMAVHPWCGICGSTDLHFESRQTGFKTMQEAAPLIVETKIKNLETLAYFESRKQNN